MPQFKALVPVILLTGRPIENPHSLRRWCRICCGNFARELFTTHVYTMHAEFQLYCQECNSYVDKPEYVAHMSQHSYDRCVEKERRAKKIMKRILDVNLAWYVRDQFCDCKNILCTFNKEMFYKICPANDDYDCITETLAQMLSTSVQEIRCAYEEHFLERISRRRKIVSLPTQLNTIGTPKQIKIAGKISNRRILDSLDKIMAVKRLADRHPESVYTYKTQLGSRAPEQNQLPGRPVRVHDNDIQVKLEFEDDLNNNSNTETNGDTDTPEVRRIERARKCRFCDEVYTSSLNYFIHVKHAHKESQGLVAPARPRPAFQCRDCNKRLTNKKSLLIHRRHHKGVKYYHCSACDKSFRWRIHLEKHEKVHGPRTKYACPTCQKVFTVKCDLLKHKRKHIVKNFPCTICNEKFTGERYLKIHVTRKHKNQPTKGVERAPKKVRAIKSTTDVGSYKPSMEPRRRSTRNKL